VLGINVPSYIAVLFAHNLVVILRGALGTVRKIEVFFRISLCPLLVIPLHTLHQECGHLHSHSVWTARCIRDV